jgi:hypothetical protein
VGYLERWRGSFQRWELSPPPPPPPSPPHFKPCEHSIEKSKPLTTRYIVTVVDTLAASYIAQSATNAASAAEAAALRKTAKYSTLSHSYHFYPVAIETLGPLSVNSQLFICELGRQTALRTSDPRETAFLFQRISVAIQRFNAVCLANTFLLSVNSN